MTTCFLNGMSPTFVVTELVVGETKRDVALCAPHTPFDDPTMPPDALFRQFAELRSVVFYD
jgi:hypothetical protein